MEIFTKDTRGVICLVGAGGKKTTMYALSTFLKGRVALSSTTQMYHYDQRYVNQLSRVEEGFADNNVVGEGRVRAYFGPDIGRDRVEGLCEKVLKRIWDSGEHDFLIIKADGARARLIKGPNPGEPLIPSFADTIIPVVSVKAVGKKLTASIAHRVERLSLIMNICPGDLIDIDSIARLMSSEKGFLSNVDTKMVIPLINMVDTEAELQVARQIATQALAKTDAYDLVVIGSMKNGSIKCIVER